MDTKNTKTKKLPKMQFSILEQTEKETKMKSQKKMWKDINEPKVEKIFPIYKDENGNLSLRKTKNAKLVALGAIVDRVPPITRERRKQK